MSMYSGSRAAEALAASPEKMLDISTHENVTLHFPAAGTGTRYVAHVLDTLIQLAALLLALVLVHIGMVAAGKSIWSLLVFLLDNLDALLAVYMGLALASMVYYLLFELLSGGRTPGKAALGLRVISATGEAASAGQIFGRSFMRFFHNIPGGTFIDGLFVLFTEKCQRAGDLAAGTVVVKFRRNREYSELIHALSDMKNGQGAADGASGQQAALFTADGDAGQQAGPSAADGTGRQRLIYSFGRVPGSALSQEELEMLGGYLNARRGMGARSGYDRRMVKFLSERTGIPADPSMNTQSRVAFMQYIYTNEQACYAAAANAQAGADPRAAAQTGGYPGAPAWNGAGAEGGGDR